MMYRLLTVLAACWITGQTGTAQDKPLEDARRIQGVWVWDRTEKQSEAQPQILIEEIIFRGDTLTFHYRFGDQRTTSKCAFSLDPKASPKQINFTPADGTNQGKTYLGIYEFKDGLLKIAYRGPGSTRPKDFTDKAAGNDSTVFIHLKPLPGDA